MQQYCEFDKKINLMLIDYAWYQLNEVNGCSEIFKSQVKDLSFNVSAQ